MNLKISVEVKNPERLLKMESGSVSILMEIIWEKEEREIECAWH